MNRRKCEQLAASGTARHRARKHQQTVQLPSDHSHSPHSNTASWQRLDLSLGCRLRANHSRVLLRCIAPQHNSNQRGFFSCTLGCIRRQRLRSKASQLPCNDRVLHHISLKNSPDLKAYAFFAFTQPDLALLCNLKYEYTRALKSGRICNPFTKACHSLTR